MLRLLVWVVVGAAVLLVAPSLIAPRYRNIVSDNAVRLGGIVIILFALGSTSYVHVPDGHLGQLFRVYGGGSLPAGKIIVGGFDLVPDVLAQMKAGYIQFHIDQQPYLQGFYTVMEMFVWKVSGGLVGPADINTGLKFVTKDAVGPYLDTKTRYEGSAKEAQIVPHTGAIGS